MNRIVWATTIKGTKLLRLTLHWIPQPWCLVIYFGGVAAALFTKETTGAPLLPLGEVGFPLCVSSKLVYFSPITFRWSTLRRRAKDHPRLALLSSLNSQFAAGFALAIERLRNCRRTTHLAQKQDFQFEISRFCLDVQEVANVYLACRLGRLPIRLNPAEITRARGQSACLEKSRCPQPLINTNAGHDSFCRKFHFCGRLRGRRSFKKGAPHFSQTPREMGHPHKFL
jgi:hypothetical protein